VHILIDITRSAASSHSTPVIRVFIPFPFGFLAGGWPDAFFLLFILNISLCQFLFSVGLSAVSGYPAGLSLLVSLFSHPSWVILLPRLVSLLFRGLY
jgi:hypothetical protein